MIPAYNEEKRLPGSLEAVTGYLAKSAPRFREVIVVDNGSSDGTAGVVERFAASHGEVRLLKNPGNRGKGFSVRHGMLEARGDWVLFSDADLSAPIEEVARLEAAASAGGAAVAIGSRALDRSLIGIHQSVFREYAGRVFNLAMRLLTGLPFWDTQCGFKLFRRDAAQQVFRRQQIERFGFDAEVLFIARLLKYRIVEVPVRWSHSEGTKVSMTADSLTMFADLFRIRRNQLLGKYR